MKKRILSILLVLVMVLGMVPMHALATANEVAVNGTQIAISAIKTSNNSYVVNGLSLYQGSSTGTPLPIESVTQDGSSIVVTLASDTQLPLAIGYSFTANHTQVSGNQGSYTLSSAPGTAMQKVMIVAGPAQYMWPYVTISLTFRLAEKPAYSVTFPTGDGFEVKGESKATEGSDYEFTVDILKGYQGDPETGMAVAVNGTPAESMGGNKYAVKNVSGPLNIAVSGVIPKESYSVTLADGTGYTLEGDNVTYHDDDYTFRVNVNTDDYKISDGGIKVYVDGTEVAFTDNNDGTYTVAALNGNKTITVSGIEELPAYAITVTKPDGVEFQGAESVRHGKDYSFTLKIDSAYNASAMTITVNGVPLETNSENQYTISKVEAPQNIVIGNVAAKTKHDVELVGGTGYNVTGESFAYDNETYTFTVKVQTGYMVNTETGLIVKVNGNKLDPTTDGKYVYGPVTKNLRVTVEGVVETGVEPVTVYSDSNKPSSFGYVSSIVIDQVQVDRYVWVGDDAYISLIPRTSDAAVALVKFGTYKLSGISNTEVSLANGRADISFSPADVFDKKWNFTLHFSNEGFAPMRVKNTSAASEATVYTGYEHTVDLAPVFTDIFGEALSYYVKIGNGEWTPVSGNVFAITPDTAGQTVLTFKANNGVYDSTDTYTVTLNVLDASEKYDVTVNVPQGTNPKFYASDANGNPETELKATAIGNVYTVEVPKTALYLAWRDGEMGMHTAVSTETNVLTLVKPSFKIMAGDNVDGSAKVTVKYGEHTALGSANTFLLLAAEGGYTYTVAPGSSAYRSVTQDAWTPESGETEIALVRKHFTVTAPAGSVVSAGTLSSYYIYSWSTPISQKTVGDTVVYEFAPLGENSFIRVQRPDDPDAVTYWDYKSSKADGAEINVTPEKLFIGDDSFNDNTVYRNFEKYFLDVGDLYMNINAKGYINLTAGKTKELNMFRNWQAIEHHYNAKTALPDFDYEIIVLDGEDDMITITPNSNNSALATLTANSEGTAIVLVTYDAMYSEMATWSSSGEGDSAPAQFSAIWPDRTGVFVVSVGKDGSSIQTNMTCQDRTFDAELTPIFYTEDTGASYSFKPEEGCTVTVNRSTVGIETLSFGQFTDNGVTVAEDGTVTVSGLTTGRHIIRVQKGALYTYQVVTAQEIEVTFTNSEGNQIDASNPAKPGDKVTLAFTGFTNPVEKLAGAYNFSAFVNYVGSDDTQYKSEQDGGYGKYDFNSSAQIIKVTVPIDWEENAYTLDNGYISLGGFSGVGTNLGKHREWSYISGYKGGYGENINVKMAQLPVIDIPVSKPINVTEVTLQNKAELKVGQSVQLEAAVLPADATNKAVTWSSSDESTASVDSNGKVTAHKAGTAVITVKTVDGAKTAQCEVTVLTPRISVESVSVQSTAEVKVGKTVTLSAVVLPENADAKEVAWSSDNDTVAYVDQNGVVTGIKAGTAVITVTTVDGGKTAQCTVTVSDIAVTEISLNKQEAEIKVGKSLLLRAEVQPDDATDKTVIWESSDPAVADVDENGKVAAVSVGTATITATSGEKTAQCRITVIENTDTDAKATVYFSVTYDDSFVKTEQGKVAALQQLNVPWFDLELYGLGKYAIPETEAGYQEPTVLHLFLYATEILQCGVPVEDAGKGYLKQQELLGTDLLTVSGDAGSLFINKFWGKGSNLIYYYNYAFPEERPGWGATSDRVVLGDGDIVTLGQFTSGKFHTDSNSIFRYLVVNGDSVTASVARHLTPTVEVYLTGSVMEGNNAVDARNDRVQAQLDVYYVKAESLTSGNVTEWTLLGTTDATGKLQADISDLNEGTYILAVAGGTGKENPTSIVSAPGAILLTVLETEDSRAVQGVIDLIDAIGTVTLDSEASINAARDAYESLNDETLQAAVNNRQELFDAEAELERLKKEKADQGAADAFTAAVDAITVQATEECRNAIQAAKTAYAALTADQQSLAETAKEKLDQLETDYAVLVSNEADKAAAKAADDMITAIGDVTLEKETAIKEAREAYNALEENRKLLVNKLPVLNEAEITLTELRITAIGTVSLESETKIAAARQTYDKLSAQQQEAVENYAVLTAAEELLALLKLVDNTDIAELYQSTGDYLSASPAPSVGTQDGEWRVLGLVRAGLQVPDSYYRSVVRYLTENMDANGRLKDAFATENARLIVALTALGKDVTNIDGYNLLAGLNEMEYIQAQGINGVIWTLIALDCHDYEPASGDVTREKLVETILDTQLTGGGWALGGQTADPDMTGMALQALAPYYATDADVKAAVDRALSVLSAMQNQNGTFTNVNGTTCESVAQVITGLTALGIDPATDARFIKNGITMIDALSLYSAQADGFKHVLDGNPNKMATEQAYYALVSYYRLLQGKTSLYDMSDVTIVIPVYRVIEGADSAWQKEDGTLTVRADGDFAKFTGVKVDGAVVDSKHYTAKAGSTVVTFTEKYLKTLDEGEHTVTLSFTDGEASTSLTVLPSDDEAAKRVKDLIDAIGTVNKNSGEKIKAARSAYDKLTAKQKELVTNYDKLVSAENTYKLLAATVSVSFTLLGCYKHDADVTHTLAAGNLSTWIAGKTYQVEAGATVKDVLELALRDAGLSYSNPSGNYVASINGIGEFTNGSLSGWMYTLNGSHPGLGVSEQTVQNGDSIVFHYTDDYTKEEGSNDFEDNSAALKAEQLIDAIGDVTLNSKDRIDAARKAYDDLAYAQKRTVSNYKKLTDAEARYAELKKADDEKIAEELKQQAESKDIEAAEKIEKLITAIGEVSENSEDAIKAAREAYDKLNEIQKALVKNQAVLEAAEAKLANLKEMADAREIFEATGEYLENLGTPVSGSVGGEWMVIGLIRSGAEVDGLNDYYDSVVKFVRENIDENGRLHRAKSTDNSRVILALTAMGKDVTNVDGHNLLAGLDDMEYICKQGINGPIWTLIALDSGNYPASGDVTRSALLQKILDAQTTDGGWTLSGDVADADMTGMALQALAPYYDSDAKVKKAVDEAIAALSAMQAADGTFGSIDGKSSESVAQVITALSALRIDAHTDARFVKNGVSALDALCDFALNGGFSHVPNGKFDGMATEQAYYALTSYFRMKEGNTSLFDMTDVIDMGGDPVEQQPDDPDAVSSEVTSEATTSSEITSGESSAESVASSAVSTPTENGRDFPWWLAGVIAVLAVAIVVLAAVNKSKKHS